MKRKQFVRQMVRWLAVAAAGATLALGCGSGSSGSTGTGGTVATGGSGTATGGSGTATGGSGPATGGTPGTGGASATGGRNGTGGAVATGGTPGTAGRGGAGGGLAGHGGGAGHAATGGGSGGASTGTGGNPAGGSTGAAGASPSAGCGMTAPASMRYSIDVSGMTREYILSVPSNYDPSHPYILIFAWHPWGGSAQQTAGTGNSGYYGLKGSSSNQAILVAPEGLDFGGMGLGWGNTNGQDIAFLQAMLALFKSEMCIDQNRIFSAGFSFGGMMSNAVGCAGLARAITPMAGNSTVSGCVAGTQPVAYMGFHGTHDSVVDISGGRTARDIFVKRNGCSSTTVPSSPSWCDGIASNYQPCTCVDYQGCMPGYPVTWCEYNADHQAAPNSGPTLWNFFTQF
jgi:polyhydroxybutyrate depolymerase